VVKQRRFEIESAAAGPFVTVLTLSGSVSNGAEHELTARLAETGLAAKRVVVDLSDAVLYDSWPFPLLVDETRRFKDAGGELVLVSGDNATVDPFVGDTSLPGLHWYRSLDDALMELLGEVFDAGSAAPGLPELG
jgi:anti-anti-sigma regulatory factor